MFPQIKSKSQQLLPYSAEMSPKMKEWNHRFVVESMPQYSPVKDPHLKKYRKESKQHNISQPQSSNSPVKHIIIRNKSSIISQLSLSSPKMASVSPKKPDDRIDVLIRFLEQKYPECNHNQFVQFHKILLSHAIPSLFIYFLLKSYAVKSMNKVEGFDAKQQMQKQIKDLKNKDGYYYKITGCWQARERFLQTFSKYIKEKVQNDQQVVQSKEKLKYHIGQLRLLTANLVQIVSRWRQHLNLQLQHSNLPQKWMRASQRPIYYIDGQKHKQNILLHILNDNKFVLSSAIASCVRMGTKNDPFLLSPLIKAENKDASQIIQIFQLTKEQAARYKKMMEYLANQKAYDLKKRPKKERKKNLNKIQKIYLQNHRQKIQNPEKMLNSSGDQLDGKNKQEKKKLKIQRMKKNKQRMQMIKAVYDRSGSRIRLNSQSSEEPMEEMGELVLPKKQAAINRTQLDEEFDRLVQERYDLIKIPLEKQPLPAKKNKMQNQAYAQGKMDSKQDNMIRKLKNLNQQLREKLQDIDKQTKNNEKNSLNKYAGKNNKQIVDELKKQIITKIEAEQQEKEMNKKRRREEEQKILNQIKQKMKKEIEEKIALKKKEKMEQKQRLERQLVEEENRIKQQREIEIQMLARISKEKELRNIEKLKREAIEKQNILKEQLAREQSLRKEKQELIQKERIQRYKLVRELEAKQLKQQLKQQVKEAYIISNNMERFSEEINNKSEQQIVRQMGIQSIKVGDSLQLSQMSQIANTKQQKNPEELKLQKQLELRKQIKLLKQKKQQEIDLIEKQNELRTKMLKLKKNEQSIIDKDIDLLYRRNIQYQQEGSLLPSTSTKGQFKTNTQQQIKKLQALEKLSQEKAAEQLRQAELNKIRKQREIEESTFREKIKQKIEKELRQEAVKRTKKQLEERQQKQYQRKKEIGEYRHKIFSQNPINRQSIIGEEKQKILESEFLLRQVKQENAKASLRSQFEQELLASSLSPKFYIDKEYLKVKNTAEYLGDDYLQEKMQANKDAVVRYQELEHSPLKKSQIREHIYDLTDEQLYIYKKQKSKNMENIDQVKRQAYVDIQDHNQYEKMNLNFEASPNKVVVPLKKNKVMLQKDSEDEKKNGKNKNSTLQKKQKNIIIKQMGQVKKAQNLKDITDSQNDVNGKNSNKQKQRPVKLKIDKIKQEKQFNSKERIKKEMKKQRKNEQEQLDRQENKKSNINENYLKAGTLIGYKKLPESQMAQKFKFGLQFEAIPQSDLDHHLEIHFSRLPYQQSDILSIKRDELYRKLVNELTFSIIIGSFQNKVIGAAYLHHDRFASSNLVSPETRKFKIAHIATYQNKQLKPFILQICNFVLLKDPCDQVQFVYHFNQNQQQQLKLSNDLTKWFNEHGSMYQKKLDERIYERKFVYKRQYFHKCEIDLNRVNKSIFKNIISMNSGIFIVRDQLHEIKQHFEVEPTLIPLQNKTLYTLLLSELFRTYMSPEEADKLKKQLKNTTYKQLLSIIIAIQKKKLKIDEYKLSEYKSLMELNMKMMSQGKQVVRFLQEKGYQKKEKGKEPGDEEVGNEIFFGEINWRGGVMFNFQVAALPMSQSQPQESRKNKFSTNTSHLRDINYFRLNPLPSYKLHLIKSSLYNTEMYMLPTESQKLKVFILPAEEYLEIKQKQIREPPPTPMTLHNYLRIYMKNISKYIEDTQYQYIWIPEISAERQVSKINDYKGFYGREIYMHDSLNMSYKQFIPSGLIIQPQHRDLVVTAPFVIGLMSMAVQQVVEGCPLYGRLVESSQLKIMEQH